MKELKTSDAKTLNLNLDGKTVGDIIEVQQWDMMEQRFVEPVQYKLVKDKRS